MKKETTTSGDSPFRALITAAVGRALLVGSQNMLKGVAIFIKLVKNIQDRTAGITKDGIYALFFGRIAAAGQIDGRRKSRHSPKRAFGFLCF